MTGYPRYTATPMPLTRGPLQGYRIYSDLVMRWIELPETGWTGWDGERIRITQTGGRIFYYDGLTAKVIRDGQKKTLSYEELAQIGRDEYEERHEGRKL